MTTEKPAVEPAKIAPEEYQRARARDVSQIFEKLSQQARAARVKPLESPLVQQTREQLEPGLQDNEKVVLVEFRKLLPEAKNLAERVEAIDWPVLPPSVLKAEIKELNAQLRQITSYGEKQILGTREFSETLMTEKEVTYPGRNAFTRVNERLATNRGLAGAMRQLMTGIQNALTAYERRKGITFSRDAIEGTRPENDRSRVITNLGPDD